MIVKAVTFFLIFMVVLAMFGRLRAPRILSRGRKGNLAKPARCPKCGAHVIGDACVCGAPGPKRKG